MKLVSLVACLIALGTAAEKPLQLTVAEQITVTRWNDANANVCEGMPGADLSPAWPDFKDRQLQLIGHMGDLPSESVGCLFGDVNDGLTYYVITVGAGEAMALRLRLEETLGPSGQHFVATAPTPVEDERGRIACEVADREEEANHVGAGSLLPRFIRRGNAAAFREKHGFAPGEAAVVCERFLQEAR